MSTLAQFFKDESVSTFSSNVTTNPLACPWLLGSGFHISERPVVSVNSHNPVLTMFDRPAAWAVIDQYRPHVAINGGGGYETILDINKKIVVTHIIGPAVAAAGELCNLKFTVDGKETIISNTSVEANERMILGTAVIINTLLGGEFVTPWDTMPGQIKLAKNMFRMKIIFDPSTYPKVPCLIAPNEAISKQTCLGCFESMKIEVETASPITNAENKKTAVVYIEV